MCITKYEQEKNFNKIVIIYSMNNKHFDLIHK